MRNYVLTLPTDLHVTAASAATAAAVPAVSGELLVPGVPRVLGVLRVFGVPAAGHGSQRVFPLPVA
jgi:hypothetical protein